MTTQQPNPPSPQPYIHPPLTTRWRASITSFRNDFLDKDGGKWERSPWRHSLGIVLLLFTVVLWTTSNFLASVSLLFFLGGFWGEGGGRRGGAVGMGRVDGWVREGEDEGELGRWRGHEDDSGANG